MGKKQKKSSQSNNIKKIKAEIKQRIKQIKKDKEFKEIKEKIKEVKEKKIRKAEVKKAEVKEVKTEQVIRAEMQELIHPEPPAEDVTNLFAGEDIGDMVGQEIKKDEENAYPREEYQTAQPQQQQEAYQTFAREGEKPEDFYRKPEMHQEAKDTYQKMERHERPEDADNLQKKIKQYLRG